MYLQFSVFVPDSARWPSQDVVKDNNWSKSQTFWETNRARINSTFTYLRKIPTVGIGEKNNELWKQGDKYLWRCRTTDINIKQTASRPSHQQLLIANNYFFILFKSSKNNTFDILVNTYCKVCLSVAYAGGLSKTATTQLSKLVERNVSRTERDLEREREREGLEIYFVSLRLYSPRCINLN